MAYLTDIGEQESRLVGATHRFDEQEADEFGRYRRVERRQVGVVLPRVERF